MSIGCSTSVTYIAKCINQSQAIRLLVCSGSRYVNIETSSDPVCVLYRTKQEAKVQGQGLGTDKRQRVETKSVNVNTERERPICTG